MIQICTPSFSRFNIFFGFFAVRWTKRWYHFIAKRDLKWEGRLFASFCVCDMFFNIVELTVSLHS